MAKGDIEGAIKAFRTAVAIRDRAAKKFGGFSSSSKYELAKALTLFNRPTEALEAYKSAFQWSNRRQDIDSNGPPFTELGTDYALLLARLGKFEEAKAMYYWVMRNWTVAGGVEYFPYLVVFEPEPGMAVWENKPEKLLSAIMMLRAIQTQTFEERKARLEEVRQREPSWLLPLAYKHGFDDKRQWIDLAKEQAAGTDEKEWVADFEAALARQSFGERQDALREVRKRLESIGVERRKRSAVLKRAKEEMAKLHPRLASGPADKRP